ncbi:MAG: cysteine desulfurase-like protein [Chloroflexota bacterium]
MTFNVETIRKQFPSIHKNKAVFFDNPAGTQVPEIVMSAVQDYYMYANANSGGAFVTSRRSDELTRRARMLVADMLNAPDRNEIVFGPNMTTLNFGLSRAIAKTLRPDDEIILTRMDHDANVSPWLTIADDLDLMVRWVDINDEDGTLNMDSLADALNDRTRIVATVHASNALGTINPVAKIAEMAHSVGAYHVVDAVQSAPHLPVDVQAIGCDFLLCSAYKFFGPHIGVMWGKYEHLAELPAYKVRPAKDKPPHRWETGTKSFETIHATAQAVEHLRKIGVEHGIDYADEFAHMGGNRTEIHAGMRALQAYERGLVAHLIQTLNAFDTIKIYGITDPEQFDNRVPTVIFTMKGYDSRYVAEHLAQYGIYVWDGHYYAIEVMDNFDHLEDGMVRVGLAHYNTFEEIDRLGAALGDL